LQLSNKKTEAFGQPDPAAVLHAKKKLAQLELAAFVAVMDAFRAQGEGTWKHQALQQELKIQLNISDDRYASELKRVACDPNLAAIARLASVSV